MKMTKSSYRLKHGECVWESVGPTDVRERKEKKKNKKVMLGGVGVCDVNKVSEKVNQWCACESVGPTDEREKIKEK